jgi:hypothetical protein
MIIIWGQRMFGKTDHVGNLFYVRTQFFHLWYIPLIPLTTYIVLAGSEQGTGFKGMQTSMSLKSVLSGWVRAACVLGGAFCLIAGLINFMSYVDKNSTEGLANALLCVGVLAGAVLLYWLTMLFSRASYHRAVELASELGLAEEAVAQLYAAAPETYSSQEPSSSSESESDDRWKQ